MTNRIRAFIVALLSSIVLFSFCHSAAAAADSFPSGGKNIHADFYPPAAARNTHRTILVLHGAGGVLFDGPEMRRVAERLARDGNSVYLVHYFNRTGSYFFAGDEGMQRNFDTWLQTLHDAVRWAVAQQAERGDGLRPVGIFGYSLGAFLALATASNNPDVAAVVEHAGGVWNNQERRIGRMPAVLVIHGTDDARVPYAKYAEPLLALLRRRGAPVEKLIFPGEGHGFSPAARAEVREHAAEFFRRKFAGNESR